MWGGGGCGVDDTFVCALVLLSFVCALALLSFVCVLVRALCLPSPTHDTQPQPGCFLNQENNLLQLQPSGIWRTDSGNEQNMLLQMPCMRWLMQRVLHVVHSRQQEPWRDLMNSHSALHGSCFTACPQYLPLHFSWPLQRPLMLHNHHNWCVGGCNLCVAVWGGVCGCGGSFRVIIHITPATSSPSSHPPPPLIIIIILILILPDPHRSGYSTTTQNCGTHSPSCRPPATASIPIPTGPPHKQGPRGGPPPRLVCQPADTHRPGGLGQRM